MLKPPQSLIVAWILMFGGLFLSPAAAVLTQAAYNTARRGNFTVTANGAVQSISAATHPGAFWTWTVGLSSVAALLVVAVAVLLTVSISAFIRSWRRAPNNI